ncbi:MAG: hypothetical protein KC635_02770 [Myxococcales bacterium]|nr:hypothetical protein [Myxococcales bacterium]MCB9733963.1 hypothetical protein [Deltaproteobacteria bacterium]
MSLRIAACLVLSVLFGCRGEAPTPADAPAPPPGETGAAADVATLPDHEDGVALTPNALYARGTPTFIVGTTGDELARRTIGGQVTLLRAMLFPTAAVVPDASVDVAAGPAAWPPNPVVFGGPGQNSVAQRLAADLPFAEAGGALVIGDERLVGDGYAVTAAIPGRREAASDAPAHPAFVLYAGTGPLAVAEINARARGDEPLTVCDAFGRLTGGTLEDGGRRAVLAPRAERPDFRAVTRPLPGVDGQLRGGAVTFHLLAGAPPDDDEAAWLDAVTNGFVRAVTALDLFAPPAVDVYVYPDEAEKARVTGRGGAGHAVPAAGALHMVRYPLERGAVALAAHEGTHLLAAAAWGPPGTPAMGEGLAVWVSGGYGGERLDDLAARVETRPPAEDLLGPGFRALPEAEAYPLAGLLVAAAVVRVGVDGLRDELYGATAETWGDACRRAGISDGALDVAYRALFAPTPRP